jgi:hypothetical protein
MKRIYIAGPYTAKNARLTQQNVDNAVKIGCSMIRKGWAPFIPHLSHYIWMHPEGDFDYPVWTALDFEWLKHCDAFYYISPSPGADAELKIATEMGIPIYMARVDVPDLKEETK